MILKLDPYHFRLEYRPVGKGFLPVERSGAVALSGPILPGFTTAIRPIPQLYFPWRSNGLSINSQARMAYLKQLKKSSYEMEKSGLMIETFEYRKTKERVDQIDTLLAEHYGFTPEELDFIINYDIKYRMGLSGGSAEEVDDE